MRIALIALLGTALTAQIATAETITHEDAHGNSAIIMQRGKGEKFVPLTKSDFLKKFKNFV